MSDKFLHLYLNPVVSDFFFIINAVELEEKLFNSQVLLAFFRFVSFFKRRESKKEFKQQDNLKYLLETNPTLSLGFLFFSFFLME